MADPMSTLSPEKLNASTNSMHTDDDFDMTFHDPPSSPFVSHLDVYDQENIAPDSAPTLLKAAADFDDVPPSAFKVSPEKKLGLKERNSPIKTSPVKNLMADFEEVANVESNSMRMSSKKSSPVKQASAERPGSALSSRSRKSQSPSKSSRAPSAESTQRMPVLEAYPPVELDATRPGSSHNKPALRENEGLTVAMKFMDETRTESRETLSRQRSYEDEDDVDIDFDNTDFNPDGPEFTSVDIDDTGFSMFSEMPGIDMTKFNALRQSPMKDDILEVGSRTPIVIRTNDRIRPLAHAHK